MRFGPTPLEEAVGHPLAHTLRLPDGTVLRKGRALTPDDVAALRAAGVEAPVLAVLEAGDVGEDEAARRVAAALAGAGVRVEAPQAGRSNLVADVEGVVRIDAGGVRALNALDEAVQVATLAPWTPVHPGTIVATVKVVTFGVAEAAVAAAEARAAPGAERPGGLVEALPFRPLSVGLLTTRLPGTPERAEELARDRLAARIRERGGRLLEPRSAEHEAAAVAAAVEGLREEGAELVLVFGASATVDRGDVLPSAVAALGGEVVQLGMPVDPGNLLLLADVGGTPVVGAPGCARSPRPSGLDRVLDRLMAGAPVGPGELAEMGVGGLLKDVAARPAPRTRTAPSRPPRTAAVLLAAGSSRRMGADNKLVLEVGGEPMVRRVATTALDAGLDPVVVVTGHDAGAVEAALDGLDLRTVHNPRHGEGMSTSLAAGVGAVPESAEAFVVLLGDMPWVSAGTLEALRAAFRPEAGASVCVPVHEGKRGNPVLWARRHAPRMATVEGDRGARSLLLELADEVAEVEVDDPGVLRDVDRPEALAEEPGPG